MLYELTDQVRQNILALLGRVDIKGGEWRVIAEIEQALNNPVQADKPEKPEKPTTKKPPAVSAGA